MHTIQRKYWTGFDIRGVIDRAFRQELGGGGTNSEAPERSQMFLGAQELSSVAIRPSLAKMSPRAGWSGDRCGVALLYCGNWWHLVSGAGRVGHATTQRVTWLVAVSVSGSETDHTRRRRHRRSADSTNITASHCCCCCCSRWWWWWRRKEGKVKKKRGGGTGEEEEEEGKDEEEEEEVD